MIGLGVIWPLIPVYAVELGAGGLLVGLIIASFNASRVIFSPFVGRISDRLGRKKFIMVGLFAYSIVLLLYVLPEKAETLILIRFIHGIASVMVVPIAMALAADIAPKHDLGLYMGTLNMAAWDRPGSGRDYPRPFWIGYGLLFHGRPCPFDMHTGQDIYSF